ncbi:MULTISPECIES: 3-hydroxyacyl-CoA dehydrogenase [Microbulbifer]|uniref:3-hydroxyacyl-CoA dehydrogenase n=1 Tax=Microbulbifer TaxID=48073 RepID=UPI001CD4BA33|nr:3-hydroxyacyl-CoA dehydrogenase NAD-binding domain-containing protein [Microbulbifer agarilyticus]MCA0900057.1 hypothetical protein [Microbulbifer agarilyticus]
MNQKTIKKICYIGAGTMGSYNALIAAIAGYQVTLFDQDEDALLTVRARQQEIAGLLIASGKVSQVAIDNCWARVRTCSDLAVAIGDADLVSESVTESLEIKRTVLRQLEALMRPGTLLTSNTSALLPSDMDVGLRDGETFAALHSYLGAPLMDIVPGPRASERVVAVLEQYVRSLGCVPMVLHKEYPGYILNSLLGPLLTTAMLLVSRSRATVEQVDRAWMRHMGGTMGPFGMMDLFGLNVVLDSWRRPAQTHHRAQFKAEIIRCLQPIVAAGHTGMKSGQGFYCYPAPTYASESFLRSEPVCEEIFTALIGSVVQAGLLIVADGAASAEEVDRAWRIGTTLKTAPLELVTTGTSQVLREEVLSTRSDLSLLSETQQQQARGALAVAAPA